MIDALGSAKFLIQGEKFKEAKEVLDIIYPYCKTIEQLDAIGAEYINARAWDKACDIAYKLYDTVDSQFKSNARQNLIKCLINVNKPEEALKFIDEENCNSIDAQLEKSVALFMSNRKEESERLLLELITKDCSDEIIKRILFNLAIHKMARGGKEFQLGLKDFLFQGRSLNIWKNSNLPKEKEWKGDFHSPFFPKSKLVIIAEGGIGDEIINVRFAKLISDKFGFDVRWKTDRKDLADVFERNGISCDTSNLGDDWYWTYSMLLPIWLNIKEDELWTGPYIKAKGVQTITDINPKIGFKVQGNPYYEQNLHRSLSSKELSYLLFESCGTTNKSNFYNFDLNLTDLHLVWWVNYLGLKIKTWDDTLDYLNQMDVVVTSCTSIAHAASAMGKRTIVLVPIMNYYIWAKPGNTSPWYGPNTTVLRQVKPGNWDEPLDELRKILEKHYS